MFQSLYFWAALPLALLFFNRLHERVRLWILPITSFALVLYQDAQGALILAVLALAVLAILLKTHTSGKEMRYKISVAGICLVLAVLIFFKYFPPFFKGGDNWMAGIALPLGISFLAFRLIHVLVEHQRGSLPRFTAQDFCLYVFFFPIWLAGPIQRFDEFLENRLEKVTVNDVTWGVNRIVWGLSKAFLLSHLLLPSMYAPGITPATIASNIGNLQALEVWYYLFITYFILYCDFSGYTDIAVGLSRLLGFKIVENFNYPFLAVNMSDYWRRWHMSLAKWCQSYIYMPVLARSRKPNLALYSTFVVMGLWHAASWHWVMWGVYHASGVLIFRTWDTYARKKLSGLPRQHFAFAFGGNLITLSYVVGAGAFTSMHGIAPISVSFTILTRAIGL
jgi:alginate O-acetyltransferase complex protein AlgI